MDKEDENETYISKTLAKEGSDKKEGVAYPANAQLTVVAGVGLEPVAL